MNLFYCSRSVFIKLFVSVMLALILFAIAMIFLTKVVHDNNNNSMRSEINASQVIEQINPFLHDLEIAPNRLQARFMLAVVKKSLDIFDNSYDAKMGLYNLSGELLVQTDGSDLPKKLPDPPTWFARTFPTLAGVPPTVSARVLSPAGFTLFYEPRQSPKHNALTAMLNLFTGTLLLLVIMAVALGWIAHSMTWRINQMSKKMEYLGEGDFSVRVHEEGNDEISTLAKGFNKSAEKIEQLINANNLLLAHASHEFRTPITRIRLQIEMMDMLMEQLPDRSKAMFEKRANAVTRDLTGLNDLIESILLVSRLDAGHALQQIVKVDLYDLITQETQHYPEVSFFGETSIIDGQPKLLTHLVRNLLNNAIIHGVAPIQTYLYGVESKQEAIMIPQRLLEIENSTNTNNLELLSDSIENQESLNDQNGENRDIEKNTNNTTEDIDKISEEVTLDKNHSDVKSNTHTFAENNFSKILKMRARLPSRPKMPSLVKNKQNKDEVHKYIALSVVDQGKGIPKEKREDIFSPFVRLKQEKKGSGLGLSLVAQIVEAHNGYITTDIWKGHTRFLIVLPIHCDQIDNGSLIG